MMQGEIGLYNTLNILLQKEEEIEKVALQDLPRMNTVWLMSLVSLLMYVN